MAYTPSSYCTVQEVTTIKRTKFKFKNPMQWADGVKYMGHPKTNVRILIVANTAGLCQYVDQDALNNALGQASAELQYVPARPRQLQLDIDGDCTLQGLYPPKRYTKVVYAAFAAWSTTFSTHNTDINNIIQPTSLIPIPT